MYKESASVVQKKPLEHYGLYRFSEIQEALNKALASSNDPVTIKFKLLKED